MTTRDELVAALAGRYALGSRADRGRMLDEFSALTGHHRKHAMRLLRAGASSGRSTPRPERRIYDQATREALIILWEASDRVCGKRLQPLLPILISAMEAADLQNRPGGVLLMVTTFGLCPLLLNTFTPTAVIRDRSSSRAWPGSAAA